MSTELADPLLDTITNTETVLCPNYHVIFLNDDYHSMEFVVLVLQMIFNKTREEAFSIMLEVHETDSAVVTTVSKERAELYYEKVLSIPEGEKGPIGCTIEPAED